MIGYEEKSNGDVTCNIIVENRRRVSVTGVEDVLSFDEGSIALHTSRGLLLVRGSELHMEKLSLDCGEVAAEGIIDAVEFETEEGSKEGFFTRLFR